MQNFQVRIIAGKWRGRKLEFTSEAVHPTHDRIRETLFNWLAPEIVGTKCLDLFAGSGALGFEAISRGAEEVVFVDEADEVVKQLNRLKLKLGADSAKVYQSRLPAQEPLFKGGAFDIVFLDPPYRADLLPEMLKYLINYSLVKAGSLVYFECEKGATFLKNLPDMFQIVRHKETKSLEYGLLRLG